MMRAGVYWIGDLGYVLRDEWDEVCRLTFTDDGVLDGEFNLRDGRRFCVYSTKFGDGGYETSLGGELSVDSGSIGAIRVSDIRGDDADIDLGIVTEFYTDFETSGVDGIITIGNVEIDTAVEYSEDFYFDGADE